MASLTEFEKAVQVLDLAYEARDEIVVCLIGPVGVGKTQAVKASAAKRGAKIVEIIASQILPNEVSGITMPDKDTKSMEIYDHFRLSSLKDGDVLFFDELLEADQSVLSACLTLIQERTLMSGKKLPDIQIVAACNPTQSPQVLKESIRQRFLFHEFELDTDQVIDYLKKKYPELDIPMILKECIKTSNNNAYNILTPRSLDKMLYWISTSSDPLIVGKEADRIFNINYFHNIALHLVNDRKNDKKKAEEQKTIDLIKQKFAGVDGIKDADTLYDVLTLLQSSPLWEEFEAELKAIDFDSFIKEGEDECSDN